MKKTLILAAHGLAELEPLLNTLQPSDMVFLDVDDTLITPKDPIFRYLNGQNPYADFMDQLKKQYAGVTDPKARAHFEQILGHWRLQREVQWVEAAWPFCVQALFDKGVVVHCLTKMERGPCGPIPSVEDWRLQELKNLGLVLTEQFLGQDDYELPLKDTKAAVPLAPLFKQGIFFTSTYPKPQVFVWIMEHLAHSGQRIVLVDDRLDTLEEIAELPLCAEQLTLCHYQAAKYLPGDYQPEYFKQQIETLVHTYRW